MKTWNHGIIGIIAVLAIITLAFTACPNDDNNGGKRTAPAVEMVRIEGGTFQMGKGLGTANAGNVIPVHTVTLDGFYMGKYEVTQGQYQAVMGEGAMPENIVEFNNGTYGKGNNYPMYFVSWYNAVEFCNALSVLERLTPYYTINKEQADPNNTQISDGRRWLVTPNATANGYRLPTEAQWEYAAKGGNTGETFTYSGSDDPDTVAWYLGNTSQEVGTKAPNGLGLYDMSGNVSEWCWDWYGPYPNDDETDPMGASGGANRVARGGDGRYPQDTVRSVHRNSSNPDNWYYYIGFRLVRP